MNHVANGVVDFSAEEPLQPMMAEEAAPILTHLDKPPPDGLWPAVDRDDAGAVEPVRNQLVARHRGVQPRQA